MKTLADIKALLANDQMAEAIEALKAYLDRTDQMGLKRQLRRIERSYQEHEKDWQLGQITKEQYQQALQQTAFEVRELIDQASERQPRSAPPPKAGSRPTKSRGGIIGKTLDSLKGMIFGGGAKSSPPAPSSSKEIDWEEMEEMSAGAEPPASAVEESAPPPPSPAPAQPASPASPFQKGKILYAIPGHMALAKVTKCRIRIAPEQISDDELSSGLSPEERKAATNESIKITSVMKVELVEGQENADNFEIVSRNSPEQPILPFMPTEWAFDVTPKRPGHYALLLRVTAKVQIAGFGERPFDVAVLDRAIQVSTDGEVVTVEDFSEQAVPDPDWDPADEKAVEQALSIGRIDIAIERIINFVQDKDSEFRDTLLLLQFRWSDNSNQLMNKLISASDWDKVNNQVRFAITQLLGKLKKHFAPEVTTPDMDWQAEEKVLREQL